MSFTRLVVSMHLENLNAFLFHEVVKSTLNHINSKHLQQPVARAAHKPLRPGRYKNKVNNLTFPGTFGISVKWFKWPDILKTQGVSSRLALSWFWLG